MSNTHYATRCPECKVVWEQCRCPGPKAEESILCPECEAKAGKAKDRT